jgi:hypothetical protein
MEADERYQKAGEKGTPHLQPEEPPRRRANQQRGQATFETDRPPMAGRVGRESGLMRLRVLTHSDRRALEPVVMGKRVRWVRVHTHDGKAYEHLPATGRDHKAVNHTPGQREWARDEDGDGIREVHCNPLEGIWTGWRNFLRAFRGVSKHCLCAYVAVFEGTYNLKDLTTPLLQAMVLCTFKTT